MLAKQVLYQLSYTPKATAKINIICQIARAVSKKCPVRKPVRKYY